MHGGPFRAHSTEEVKGQVGFPRLEPSFFAEGWRACGDSPRGGETEPEQKTVSLEAWRASR